MGEGGVFRMEVPEPIEDLLEAARVVARKRVEEDRRRVSEGVGAILAHLAEELGAPGGATLFPPGFGARALRRAASPSAEALRRFRSELDVDLRGYLVRCKIETAKSLLRYRDVKIWRIAYFVGYSGLQPFWRAFRSATGESPSEYRERSEPRARQRVPATELNSDAFWWQATVGGLTPEDHAALLVRLRARLAGAGSPDATVTLTSRGTEHEEAVARRLWETLEPLSAEERRRWVRQVRLDSPAFFHLLVEKIREQVRKDPQASLELAELALDHLEACETTLGAEVPDFQALAWAWLGNARRLTWDFAGADKAFARAREEWAAAGEDRRLEAELCDLEASLRQYQRRTGEALTLLDRSIALAEALGRPRVLVSSLLQRVAILAPRGEHRATIADLRRALGVLEELDEPGLTLVARCDLATAYVLAGRPRQALEELPEARALCAELGEAVTRHQLDWTEGLARQALGELEDADLLLEEARVGLLELGAEGYAAVAALDQAILCLERGRHPEVPRLAAGALPVFERLGLGREAVAALELLRRAIVEDAVTVPILSEARARLAASLRDPALRPNTR